MNMKSFLLGSAAALLAVTGARAADAVVVVPEPEAVEYVRVCDVYGAGYFYIPGTETCLKLSGYYRYDILYWPGTPTTATTVGTAEGYYKYARFAPEFTAKSETEWGTLTGYARIFFNWQGQPLEVPYGTNVDLDHMYIEVGGLRIGKGDTPYTRFLGYAGAINVFDGFYGFNNASELSYTWTNGTFSIIAAAVEDLDDTDWTPDAEGGINYAASWGSLGAIAGFDESDESWGGKIVARAAIGNFSPFLQVFYSGTDGTPGSYTILDPAGARTEWSVLGGVGIVVTPKITVNAAVQWFDTDEWYAAGNVAINLAGKLYMTPEVQYTTPAGGQWTGLVRFQLDY